MAANYSNKMSAEASCRARPVAGDRAAPFAEWQRGLGGSAPALSEYRQRDVAVVFVAGTFYGRDAAARCAASGEAAPAAR
jgi:hypothetical protein